MIIIIIIVLLFTKCFYLFPHYKISLLTYFLKE